MPEDILPVLIISVSVIPVLAEDIILNGKYPVCTSESASLQEHLTAGDAHRKRLNNGCFMPEAGTHVDEIISADRERGIVRIKVCRISAWYDLWTDTRSLTTE
ncbi:hypothetical protein DOA20_23145 [Salmonella enterica subsp. enterica serovar Newport]|nr:hypothetical protein [Salmonella enterica subsp. enterica serovar Newport]